MDCMEYMRAIPDKFFDLACVDPPYGLPKASTHGRGKLKNRILNRDDIHRWGIAPDPEYFKELRRVSEAQIIWGGNYFPLPPARCVLVWDKCQPWENFSQVELAWTSFDGPAQIFRFDNRSTQKQHPTQKPVELYSWIFKKFTGRGMRVLDTHLGSQSSRVAAYFAGLDFYGCEIDPGYFSAGCARFEKDCHGIEVVNGHKIQQLQLFD